MRAKGKFEEGLQACREALRLEPNSYVANRIAGLCLLGLKRYDDAIGHFERSVAAMENDFTAASFVSGAYKAKGDVARMQSAARMTLDRIEKIIAADPGHSRAIAIGACMLADLNERERAKEWVIRARLVDPENVNLHYNLACAMSSLNDVDAVVETLASIAAKLSPGMLSWMEADSDFDPIREDPRFKELMQRVKERLASESKGKERALQQV